jgi:hypothetical protein
LGDDLLALVLKQGAVFLLLLPSEFLGLLWLWVKVLVQQRGFLEAKSGRTRRKVNGRMRFRLLALTTETAT